MANSTEGGRTGRVSTRHQIRNVDRRRTRSTRNLVNSRRPLPFVPENVPRTLSPEKVPQLSCIGVSTVPTPARRRSSIMVTHDNT